MNPELLGKVEFSDTINPLKLPVPYDSFSKFLNSGMKDAVIQLGAMDKPQLTELAGALGWTKSGNQSELLARLLTLKAAYDYVSGCTLEMLNERTIPELNSILDTIGASLLSAKVQKTTSLFNWVTKTRHNLKVNVASKLHESAIREAFLAKRPIGLSAATEWSIKAALESRGYVLNAAVYEFKGAAEKFYTVDCNPVSEATLDRMIVEARNQVESTHKGIAGWEQRVRDYAPDGTWPDREFAAKHYVTATTQVAESKVRLAEREKRLADLLSVKASPPVDVQLPAFQSEFGLL